jgi:hypothetical protein
LSLLYTPSLYHLLKRFVFCLSETLWSTIQYFHICHNFVVTVEIDSLSAPTLDQRTDEKQSTIKFSPKTVQ